MKPVTVLTFNEPKRTEPIKARLERAGIAAAIYDERNVQKLCYLSEPLAGIHLRVDRKDYDRALELLHEWARTDRKSTRLNSSHHRLSRMPSSA